MPKAYWVVTYRSIKNPEAWKAYAKLAMPAIESVAMALSRLGNSTSTTRAFIPAS